MCSSTQREMGEHRYIMYTYPHIMVKVTHTSGCPGTRECERSEAATISSLHSKHSIITQIFYFPTSCTLPAPSSLTTQSVFAPWQKCVPNYCAIVNFLSFFFCADHEFSVRYVHNTRINLLYWNSNISQSQKIIV